MADRVRDPSTSRTPEASPPSDAELFGAQQDIADFSPVIAAGPDVKDWSQPYAVPYLWKAGTLTGGNEKQAGCDNGTTNAFATHLYIASTDAEDNYVAQDISNVVSQGTYPVAALIHVAAQSDAKRSMDFVLTIMATVPHPPVAPDIFDSGYMSMTVVPIVGNDGFGTLPPNVLIDGERVIVTISPPTQTLGAGAAYAPPGEVKMYAGAGAPGGYFICDGSAKSRVNYSNLFAAIGTTYGAGDGSTTFNIPNVQERFPLGAGGTHALGAAGGGAHTHAVPSLVIPQLGLTNAFARITEIATAFVSMQRVNTASWQDTHVMTTSSAATANNTARTTGAALGGQTDASATGTGTSGAASATPVDAFVTFNYIIKY